MDKLDLKILQILDWNARISLNQLAKSVKSNKDVVAYRIKRLEKNKIIQRYYPVLDMFKLGYHTSRLYFDIDELSGQQEKEFVDFLDKEIGAGLIFRMDYPHKYGIVIWVKSIYAIREIIVKIKGKLGNLIQKYNHTLFETFRQYPKDYLFGKNTHSDSLQLIPNQEVSYDESDYKILKILANNARESTVSIAKKTKIPQTTVSSKIKSLEKRKIIQGYRAEINYTKLGFMNYFLEIYLEENKDLAKIEQWANQNKNVVWLQKIIGTCDIEIEVELKDRIELEKFLSKLRESFPSIRKIIFWSQEYKKLTFLP